MAFGLIHDEVMPVLQKLGRIRNGFAHKLWLTFENKEALDFINTLRQSQLLRTRFSEIQPQNDVSRLQDAIYVTCMYLFEQLVRIASTKSILNEFWAKTVDQSPRPKRTICRDNEYYRAVERNRKKTI